LKSKIIKLEEEKQEVLKQNSKERQVFGELRKEVFSIY
jgi:hypothetical protein